MQQAAPAIWHFDGTARAQTVAVADEPWLHAVLAEVKRLTGLGMLCNTSFNTKGEPMVNYAADALCLLCWLHKDGLGLVLIHDWLFERAGACRPDSQV